MSSIGDNCHLADKKCLHLKPKYDCMNSHSILSIVKVLCVFAKGTVAMSFVFSGASTLIETAVKLLF